MSAALSGLNPVKSLLVEPGMRLLVAVVTLLALVSGAPIGWAQQAPAPAPVAPPPGPAPPEPEPEAAPDQPVTAPAEESAAPTGDPPPEGAAPGARAAAPPEPPAPNDVQAPGDVARATSTAPPEDTKSAALRYTLERIVVRGNLRTHERVVLRYLPFKPGSLIDVDNPDIRLARFRLLGTGFFKDVQFSLEKGSDRGMVILVVDVVERNTIVLNDVWMGVAADADNEGQSRPLTAYAGLDVAETNLFGMGVTLGGAMAVAEEQLALRARFLDPGFLGSPWMTSATFLYNDARDFFGNAQVLYSDPDLEALTEYAVVRYDRLGGALGVGRDLSSVLQFWLHYRLENVDASYPLQASHVRGDHVEPIDFAIIRGQSWLSTLRATLQLDTRDHPFLPTTGWFLSATGELGMPWLGSDYTYQRSDVHASHWWELPWHHVIRLEMFGGAISGDAPFFEQYYVGDFSDFLPSRILGVNFDRRPPPNFLGTQIVEVRYGEFAAKIGAEYRLPLYRGHRSIFGIDLFGSGGIYSVFGQREIESPASGYEGAERIPVDLTANVGFRMDTAAGGFVFAFSNVLYFIPVGTKGPAGE
ncbi:MAG TPA: BamA/TamA family outer membrane protein [Polyangiaceae bacterium]|nr:BamA/TamA family outer membrane protein [Polyangiaceae bacterium]